MKPDNPAANKILIAGKLPLPIGGVRIHVQRLLSELKNRGYTDFHFFDFEKISFWKFPYEILRHAATHLHTSNPWLQLSVSLFCLVFRKSLIITYHSNWGRYRKAGNMAEALSALFAKFPLVQNNESLQKALKWNKNATLVSTFIPPVYVTPLQNSVLKKVLLMKQRYRFLFCTNAWNLTYDRDRNEIYGISALVAKMNKTPSSALIISDPSGKYQNFLSNRLPGFSENIMWISSPHDFWNVLQLSDAFIRNTTTDATAISIQEALCCDCAVFATSVVSRPAACYVYQNISEVDLEAETEKMLGALAISGAKPSLTQTVDVLLNLYGECRH